MSFDNDNTSEQDRFLAKSAGYTVLNELAERFGPERLAALIGGEMTADELANHVGERVVTWARETIKSCGRL